MHEESEDDFTESPATEPELRVLTQAYDLSINTLNDQWNDGQLILPEIQRSYVWDNKKASRLIESLLLSIPVPPLYFAELSDSRMEVIDGHQRVKSINRFLAGDFPLRSLQVLPTLNGTRFRELNPSMSRRLKSRVIRAIVIQVESNMRSKYEVFERLNSGSVALSPQELRNVVYRGPFNDAIKVAVRSESFRALIGKSEPRPRMVDEELLTRFFSLREHLAEYRPGLKLFMNNRMEQFNMFTPIEIRSCIEYLELTIERLRQIFPNRCFQRHDAYGNCTERGINRALFDAYMIVFSHITENDLTGHRDSILNQLHRNFSDQDFEDSISRATGDRSNVLNRIRHVRQSIIASGATVSPEFNVPND